MREGTNHVFRQELTYSIMRSEPPFNCGCAATFMNWSRREFLRTCLSGSIALPLAGGGIAADLTSLLHLPRDPDNSVLLENIERVSFDYFWNEANPGTGLVKDRARADGADTRRIGSIAATGFGLTALCIGDRRGFASRQQIRARVRGTLKFLALQAPQVYGFLYHFVDVGTGARHGHSEVSPIDMAILLCGVLTCRQYFEDPQIQDYAAKIYNRVDWPWALNGGDTFALAWTPERGFNHLRWNKYNECMMLYLLAMGSPTHPIAASSWNLIRRPWVQYENYRFIAGSSPLFVHQFSHAWFDFREKRDAYTNYFENSVMASRAHRKFCQRLAAKFPCYSKDVWGITASDSIGGYVAWGGPPIQGPIDGTIVPAAAAGSLPFVPEESLAVLHRLRSQYGRRIWKRYGFVDAFNPLTGWISPDVVGIDVGITMLMAENARTQLVWDTFMQNSEINAAMERAGFHAQPDRVPMLASHAPIPEVPEHSGAALPSRGKSQY